MEQKRSNLATRYYVVPREISNQEIARLLSLSSQPVFLQDGEYFAPSQGSGFLGYRLSEKPEWFALMAGWSEDVYNKAASLFRLVSPEESALYEQSTRV